MNMISTISQTPVIVKMSVWNTCWMYRRRSSTQSESAQLLQVSVNVPLHLCQRVPAEFLAHRVGEDDRQHRFADHAAGGDGRHVAAFPLRAMRVPGFDVDRG